MKKFEKNIIAIAICLLATSFTTLDAKAAVLFTDTFDSGVANSAWGNESGEWYVHDGVYDTLYPDNAPITYTSVNGATLSNLTDFTVDVDIKSLSDGGIYLRSTDSLHGILLVTRGGYDFQGVYWHVVNGDFSDAYNLTDIADLRDSNSHIKVTVEGNTYTAAITNGSGMTVESVFTDSTYTSGKVALYDNSGQSFDNVVISGDSPAPAPEPSTLILGFLSLGGLFGLKKRK